MNADAFRQFYDYHFTENRKVWEIIISLSQEQFTQALDYSYGSVRNQIVHLISADETWFCELRGVDIPESLNPADFDDRETSRSTPQIIERFGSQNRVSRLQFLCL